MDTQPAVYKRHAKTHPLLFVLLILPLLFPSCYDEANTYGDRLVDSAFRNISVDTSTVLTTAVLIDSLETSGKNVILAGRYTHPVWGTVAATSYIPYSRPSYGTDIEAKVALDSLVLSLTCSGQFVGDTTTRFGLHIHRLTEKIILNDNDYLYNHSAFAYAPEPLASYTFKPKPHWGERMEIRLPDALGQDLLERFHTRDEAVSEDRFADYFKGIALVADTTLCRSLLTFQVADTLSSLILYYHIEEELAEQRELVFQTDASLQFNHIDHDRSGTSLESYAGKQVEIPSAQIDNRGLLFGNLGWYTRVEFPYLNNLMQQGRQIEIESALLKIYPEPGTYSEYNALPDSIFLYIADENNVVTEAVTDYLGTQVQGGVLVRDDTFAENTYFYFDVTQFMQEELGTFGMYKHNLQLVFNEDDYTQTFKNLTFSDQNGRSPIVLQLIYKIYESY